MPYTYVPVKVFRVERICDNCGEGFYVRFWNYDYTTNPEQFPHKCKNCGYEKTFTDSYPKFVYEEIKQ
jgi:hypothetical protein